MFVKYPSISIVCTGVHICMDNEDKQTQKEKEDKEMAHVLVKNGNWSA